MEKHQTKVLLCYICNCKAENVMMETVCAMLFNYNDILCVPEALTLLMICQAAHGTCILDGNSEVGAHLSCDLAY